MEARLLNSSYLLRNDRWELSASAKATDANASSTGTRTFFKDTESVEAFFTDQGLPILIKHRNVVSADQEAPFA